MSVLDDPLLGALSKFTHSPKSFPRVIGKEGYIDYITKPTPVLDVPHMLLVEQVFNLHTDGKNVFVGRCAFTDATGQGYELITAWCQVTNRKAHRWISAARPTTIVWTVRKQHRKKVA